MPITLPCSCVCNELLVWAMTLSDRATALVDVWDEGDGMTLMDVDDTVDMLNHLGAVYQAAQMIDVKFPFAWPVVGHALTQLAQVVQWTTDAVRAGSQPNANITQAVKTIARYATETYTLVRHSCMEAS